MFRGLVASMPNGAGGGFGRSGVLSALVHGVLLAAAVFGTREEVRPLQTLPHNTTIIWVDDERVQPRPADLPFGLRAMFAPIRITFPLAPIIAPVSVPSLGEELFVTGQNSGLPPEGDVLAIDAPTGTWIESEVDEKPERILTPPLEYPELLRQAGFEGTVTIEVVVDTLGRAEPGSLRVTRSDSRAFDGPARNAVLRSVFRPGRVRGRPVRVLVQLPVTFTIHR